VDFKVTESDFERRIRLQAAGETVELLVGSTDDSDETDDTREDDAAGAEGKEGETGQDDGGEAS
jgi:hypothetical protein